MADQIVWRQTLLFFIWLDASTKKSQISRKHLQILREGERWFVRRLAANPAKLRRAGAGGGDIDIGGAGKPTSETVRARSSNTGHK